MFLHDTEHEATYVLRGPLSSVPCFWTDRFGVTLFFSDPEIAAELGLIPLEVNWDQIRAQAVRGDYLAAETGLKGISTFLSGDCLELRCNLRRHYQYWTPRAALDKESPSDVDSAAASIRAAVQSTINSMASLHNTALVSLSGGLDSSIVSGCLASVPHPLRLVAVNHYSSHADDERHYARSMATKVGATLIEIQRPGIVDFRMLQASSQTVTPEVTATSLGVMSTTVRLCHESQATALFTGELGDDVFGHAYGPEALAESFYRYRLSTKTYRAILDYAILYRVSVWRAAKLLAVEYSRYRTTRSWHRYRSISGGSAPADPRLTTADAVTSYERDPSRFVHPWLLDVQGIPPGALQTVLSLVGISAPTTWASFFATEGIVFNRPLAAQPVVEASLAIPANLQLSADQNAVVTRHAFHSLLSTAVLERGTSKGTNGSWLNSLVAQNRPFLRELLLDGLLVNAGILDMHKTEAALSGAAGSRTRISDLLTQLAIECWLQRWSAHRCYGKDSLDVLQAT